MTNKQTARDAFKRFQPRNLPTGLEMPAFIAGYQAATQANKEALEFILMTLYAAKANAVDMIANMELQVSEHGGIGFSTKEEEDWMPTADKAIATLKDMIEGE